jgi:hypothetical protein
MKPKDLISCAQKLAFGPDQSSQNLNVISLRFILILSSYMRLSQLLFYGIPQTGFIDYIQRENMPGKISASLFVVRHQKLGKFFSVFIVQT